MVIEVIVVDIIILQNVQQIIMNQQMEHVVQYEHDIIHQVPIIQDILVQQAQQIIIVEIIIIQVMVIEVIVVDIHTQPNVQQIIMNQQMEHVVG